MNEKDYFSAVLDSISQNSEELTTDDSCGSWRESESPRYDD